MSLNTACAAVHARHANNDSAYAAALALADAGVEIAALVDLRAEPGTHAVRGLSVRAGQAVVAARDPGT